MIFFLCSGSYTLCKNKPYINQSLRQNRTNVFTSHLVNSNLYNTNPTFRNERSSVNSFNEDYLTAQYYRPSTNDFRSISNVAEPTISFINTPPPPYWQIMNQNSTNNHIITQNNGNSIRAPPPYLNVSNLNKQDIK